MVLFSRQLLTEQYAVCSKAQKAEWSQEAAQSRIHPQQFWFSQGTCFFICAHGGTGCVLSPPDQPDVSASRAVPTLVFLLLHVPVVLAVCTKQLVPPREGGGVVPHEVHVVKVVETGAGVERDEVERVQRDVITADRKNKKYLVYCTKLLTRPFRMKYRCLCHKT